MTRHRPLTHALAVLLLLPALLLSLGAAPPTARADDPARGPVVTLPDLGPDAGLSAQECGLLARAYEPGQGCSRTRCVDGGPVFGHVGAEHCRYRGQLLGEELHVSRCEAAHRRWIPAVNLCARFPGRHDRDHRVDGAPQCVGAWSTYVVHTGGEGFDECLRPGRADRLQRRARATGRSFTRLAALTSRAICGSRENSVFRGGRCHRLTRGGLARRAPRGVLVVGDSITWRGTDELDGLVPRWTVDGRTGRSVKHLGHRIDAYLRSHPAPATLVVALGSNPFGPWRRQDYLRSVRLVPRATRVVLVTPYRDPEVYGRQRFAVTSRYAAWMRGIAAHRPGACLVDWRSAAMADPSLLIDGVHPSPAGEDEWARMLVRGWRACGARR